MKTKANTKRPRPEATPESDRRKKEEAEQTFFPFWIDPVTLSEEADQPELDLLGKRGFLRRGGGMFIVGPTEVGKSSLATQLSIEWGCNHPHAIIKTANNQALRVLMVQCEDDKQDSREMARCIKFLKLSEEQKAQAKANVHFAQWRACGEIRVIEGTNGESEVLELSATDRLLEVLEDAIKKFGPVDIIIVNPLSAYAEEGVMSQKANQRLLYGLIDPFLEKHNCGIIFIHHTPKLRDDDKREKRLHALIYAGAGDATLSNWPRASLFIWPLNDENRIFEFRPGKRANRLGWEEEHRFYKWSDEGIFWLRASDEDVRQGTHPGKRDPAPEDLLRLIPPFDWDLAKRGPRDILREQLFAEAKENKPSMGKTKCEDFLKILKAQKKIDWVERKDDSRERGRGSKYFVRIEP